ncbi:YlbG family protein [Alkalibacterium sp. MB6]|uniref:YlbG family protein n=1 Tax=Alkalibacterium sp. MB6 TaxID=2081965 RepID=UPI00137B4F1D|nr:YlbG family protein [Alkalibacterium sp. MB6]
MEEVKPTRAGLVVWLYTSKYINKLKRYGLIHYVSKNMNYAIVYVNRDEKESVSKAISKQHFVRRVEDSYQCELPKTFEGVLDQVTALAVKKKEDESARLVF